MNVEQLTEKWQAKLEAHFASVRLKVLMEGSKALQHLLLESKMVFGSRYRYGKMHSTLHFISEKYEWSIQLVEILGKKNDMKLFRLSTECMHWTLDGRVHAVHDVFSEDQELIKEVFEALEEDIQLAATEYKEALAQQAFETLRNQFIDLKVVDVQMGKRNIPILCFDDGTKQDMHFNLNDEKEKIVKSYVQYIDDF